ncbi:histidine kinase [Paenimyroides baculatum]|uniref:Histidine kinase n=1 Tax=Paenimyroides baculatum TaxID=2608000 RepID=A0A5M6CQJ6_9FLAO|nr:histidine kinase [Paenimyroides baculatum]KAA5537588.1 histidine kinase [Paenimyroides baculatum]
MKDFLRHLKQFSIILVICYVIVLAINFEYTKQFNSLGYLKQFLNVFTYTFGIYLANTLVLSDYYLKRKKSLENFVVGGILVNILTAVVVLLLEFLGYLVIVNNSVAEAFTFVKNNSTFMLWFSMTISTTVYIVLLIRRKEKIEVTQQKDIAVKATASFETLKNQLDPHFLFNSLNVLSSLIEENPKKAQEFTVALSKIYRYVLDQKDKNLISVEEELNFAKLYVSLLKMRFEDAIIINFQTDIDINDFRIVPLSLQLLLENTIKHNIISDQKPLRIDIFKEENYLVVQNSYQKKQTFEKSTGIGLQNIIQRYNLVSNLEINIQQTDKHYIVKLPLISGESLYTFQEDQFTEEIFNNAYDKMYQLKEFYVTVFAAVIVIPLAIVLNFFYLPHYKWSLAIVLFMLFALFINGIKTINFLKNWENKMINKQINKNRNHGKL